MCNNSANFSSNSKGFTFIELILAVGIMGLTLGFGMPSFQKYVADNRLTTAVNDMVMALRLARSTSIKETKLAGVSIDTDAKTWYTFLENSTDPTKVKQRYSAATGVTIDVTSLGATDETPTYRPDGRLDSNAAITLTFEAEGTGNHDIRTLTIAPSGLIHVD